MRSRTRSCLIREVFIAARITTDTYRAVQKKFSDVSLRYARMINESTCPRAKRPDSRLRVPGNPQAYTYPTLMILPQRLSNHVGATATETRHLRADSRGKSVSVSKLRASIRVRTGSDAIASFLRHVSGFIRVCRTDNHDGSLTRNKSARSICGRN